MKVCIIAHSHPDFSKGGGEIAAYRQFVTQMRRGDDVTLVCASPLLTDQTDSAAPQVYAEGPREMLFSYRGMHEHYLAWEDLEARERIISLLDSIEADVYHFHHYWRVGVDLIERLMDMRPSARFVMTLHEMLAICANHGQMVRSKTGELCERATPLRCLTCFPELGLSEITLRRAVLYRALNRMSQLIYPSQFIRRRYEDWGLAPERGVVLENFLGRELLGESRGTPGAPSGAERRFAFFGQATEFKGIDTLVEGFSLALRSRDDITLTFHGPRESDILRLFPALSKTIDLYRGNIFFSGRYSAHEVVRLMQSSGWIVVPSIWWENSPVVIQEAKRAGVPLIVSNIGGMAEKVTDGVDGLHFRRGSPVDLAATLLQAAEPETHHRLSRTQSDSIAELDFLRGLDRAFDRPSHVASQDDLQLGVDRSKSLELETDTVS